MKSEEQSINDLILEGCSSKDGIREPAAKRWCNSPSRSKRLGQRLCKVEPRTGQVQKGRVESVKEELQGSNSTGGDVPSCGYPVHLRCVLCRQTFSLLAVRKFRLHMRHCHSLQALFQCQACLRTFSQPVRLKHHSCCNATSSQEDDEETDSSNVTVSSKVTHTCYQCTRTFATLYEINLHRWSSPEGKVYRCLTCSKMLGSLANLSEHINAHSRRRSVRQQRLQQNNNNNDRKRKKLQKKTFRCDFCSGTFPNLSLAMEHRRSNHISDSTGLTCNCCGRTFQDSTYLGCHFAQAQCTSDTEQTDTASTSLEEEGVEDKDRSVSKKEEKDVSLVVMIPTHKNTSRSLAPMNGADVMKDQMQGQSSFPIKESEATVVVGTRNSESSQPLFQCEACRYTFSLRECHVTDSARVICLNCGCVLETVASESAAVQVGAVTDKLYSTSSSGEVSLSPQQRSETYLHVEALTAPRVTTAQAIEGTSNLPAKRQLLREDKDVDAEPPEEIDGANSIIMNIALKKVGGANDVPLDSGSKETDGAKSFLIDSNSKEENGANSDRNQSAERKNFQCDICKLTFGSVTWVMRHRKTHSTKSFSCQVCKRTFLRSSELGHHLAICRTVPLFLAPSSTPGLPTKSDPEAETSCPINSNPVNLNLANPTKTREKLFTCDFCSLSFASISWIMRHRKLHVRDFASYQCQLCTKTFEKSSDFGRHLSVCPNYRQRQRLDDSGPSLQPPLETQCCEKDGRFLLQTKDVMTTPVALMTEQESSPEGSTTEQLGTSSSCEQERKFKCDFCCQRFASARWVMRHRKCHTSDIVCQGCLQVFEKSVDLGRHLGTSCSFGSKETQVNSNDTRILLSRSTKTNERTDDKISAADLGEMSVAMPSTPEHTLPFLPSSNQNLTTVVLSDEVQHSWDSSFHCDYCPQSFANARWVIRHRKQHLHGEENLTCQRCHALFTRSAELGKHLSLCAQRRHGEMGEGSVSSNLEKHRQTSPSIPAALNQGTALSPQKSQDTAAVVISPQATILATEDGGGGSSSYCCDLCGQTYASARWVMRHRRSHSNGDSYVCQNCHQVFPRSVEISRHLGTCHVPIVVAAVAEPLLLLLPSQQQQQQHLTTSSSLEAASSTTFVLSESDQNKAAAGIVAVPGEAVATSGDILNVDKSNEDKVTIKATSDISGTSLLEDRDIDSNNKKWLPPLWQCVTAADGGSLEGSHIESSEDGKYSSCEGDSGQKHLLKENKIEETERTSGVGVSDESSIEAAARTLYQGNIANENGISGYPTETPGISVSLTSGSVVTMSSSSSLLSTGHQSDPIGNEVNTNTTTTTAPLPSPPLLSPPPPLQLCNSVHDPQFCIPNSTETASPLGVTATRTFQCDFCPEMFVSPTRLMFHRRSHPDGMLPYQCPDCANVIDDSADLALHLDQCTAKINSPLSGTVIHLENQIVKRNTIPLPAWNTISCLSKGSGKHELSELETKAVPSTVGCQKQQQARNINNCETLVVKSTSTVSVSMTTSLHNNCYACDFCPGTFTTAPGLLGHRCGHTSSQACRNCGCLFKILSDLAIHLRVCRGHRHRYRAPASVETKQYRCDFCWKQYGGSNWIMRHRRFHTAEKQYCCRICGYLSSSPGDMAKHLSRCPWVNDSNSRNKGNWHPAAGSPQPQPSHQRREPLPSSLPLATPLQVKEEPDGFESPKDGFQCDCCSQGFASECQILQHRCYSHMQNSPLLHHQNPHRHHQMALHDANNCNLPGNMDIKRLNRSEQGEEHVPNNGSSLETTRASHPPLLEDRSSTLDGSTGSCRTIEDNVRRRCNNLDAVVMKVWSQQLPVPPASLVTSDKVFSCDFCGHGFASNNWVMRHRRLHTKETLYTCRNCGDSFEISHEMAVHLIACKRSLVPADPSHVLSTHHPTNQQASTTVQKFGDQIRSIEPQSCWTMKTTSHFHSKKNMINTTMTSAMPGADGFPDLNKRTFTCDFCGKDFGSNNWIVRHRKLHTQETVFECRNCGETFGSSHKMALHLTICKKLTTENCNNASFADSKKQVVVGNISAEKISVSLEVSAKNNGSPNNDRGKQTSLLCDSCGQQGVGKSLQCQNCGHQSHNLVPNECQKGTAEMWCIKVSEEVDKQRESHRYGGGHYTTFSESSSKLCSTGRLPRDDLLNTSANVPFKSNLVLDGGTKFPSLVVDGGSKYSGLVDCSTKSLSLVVDLGTKSSIMVVDGSTKSPSMVVDGGTKSPSMVVDGGSKSPSMVMDGGSKSPSMVVDGGSKSPSMVVDGGSKSPSMVVDSGSKSPSMVMDGGSKSPSIVVDGSSKSPSMVVDGGSKSPSMVVDGGSKSPSMVVDGDSKSSSMVVDGGSKSSSMVVDGGSKSPSMVVDGGSKSPSMVVDGGSKSPSMVVDGGSKSPSMVVDGGSKSPSMVVDGGCKSPSMVVDGDSKSPSMVVDGGSKSPSMVVDGGSKSPSMVVDGGTRSPSMVVDCGRKSPSYDKTRSEFSLGSHLSIQLLPSVDKTIDIGTDRKKCPIDQGGWITPTTDKCKMTVPSDKETPVCNTNIPSSQPTKSGDMFNSPSARDYSNSRLTQKDFSDTAFPPSVLPQTIKDTGFPEKYLNVYDVTSRISFSDHCGPGNEGLATIREKLNTACLSNTDISKSIIPMCPVGGGSGSSSRPFSPEGTAYSSTNNGFGNSLEKFAESLNLISKKSKFRCDFCEEAFALGTDLIKHRMMHITETSLWCRNCRRILSSPKDLAQHLSLCRLQQQRRRRLGSGGNFPYPYTDDKMYRCDFCSQKFPNSLRVMRHRKEHAEEDGVFRCRRCDTVFYRSGVFADHLASNCLFPCSSSGGGYESPTRAISKAMAMASPPPSMIFRNGMPYSWRRFVSPDRQKLQRLFHCDFCQKTFAGSNWIMRHRRGHTSEMPYKCRLCGAIFVQPGCMAEHLLTCIIPSEGAPSATSSSSASRVFSSSSSDECNDRGGKRFQATTTGNTRVASPNRNNGNMQQQQQQAIFKCDFCTEMFQSVSEGLRHRQDHTNSSASPLNMCQCCGHRFESLNSLGLHLTRCSWRLHQKQNQHPQGDQTPGGTKIHGAELISDKDTETKIPSSYSFASSPLLKPRPQEKTPSSKPPNEQPSVFACDFCGKPFLDINLVLQHRKTHTVNEIDEFQCHHCGEEVGEAMLKHLAICSSPSAADVDGDSKTANEKKTTFPKSTTGCSLDPGPGGQSRTHRHTNGEKAEEGGSSDSETTVSTTERGDFLLAMEAGVCTSETDTDGAVRAEDRFTFECCGRTFYQVDELTEHITRHSRRPCPS